MARRNLNAPGSQPGNNIAGVADATQSTTATLGEVDRTVAELGRLAHDLQQAVGSFKV